MNPISLTLLLTAIATLVAMSLIYGFLLTPLITIPIFLLVYFLFRKTRAFAGWTFAQAIAVIVLSSFAGMAFFPVAFALVLHPSALRLLCAGAIAGLLLFSFFDVIFSLMTGKAISRSAKSWGIPLLSLLGAILLLRAHPCGLMHAAEDGYRPIVKLLLALKQDIQGDSCEFPPLVKGARYPGITRDLLAAGADVNRVSQWKQSALHLARGTDALEVAKILLAARADVNAVDAWGETPLFAAVKKGNLDLVKLLLDSGADANWINKAKQSPLSIAKEANFDEIAELLQTRVSPVTSN